ncbi:MAG: hypothetical protein B6241_06825 [Spirochaetaceae bacterium 4572_59]|nr:MAG: hypothetical protein B6241_06825 [Spirochaetaceae bacterium 4572_59]
MKDKIIFRKHMIARVLNFLFLIPFIMGFRPLIIRYNKLDLMLYVMGTLTIILLIVVSNRLPYITLKGDRLILNLHYYQKPEVHFMDRITLIETLSNHSVKIHSRDFKPVRIHLNPWDLKKLLKLLDERNLKIN